MMNRIFPIFFLLLFVATGCKKDPDPWENELAYRTVLVYVAADNSLGNNGFATDDVKEMLSGMEQVDDRRNNFLVYLDRGGETELFRLTKDQSGTIFKKPVQSYSTQNSVSPEVMKKVFTDAFSAYPAESYGLILWSHGEGWIPSSGNTRWFGQDGLNYMDISELKEALKTAPRFEYIYFDACFMQSVEVLYELRECADYFIGSPTEIPGPGSPYDLILPALFQEKDAAMKISKTYFDYYHGKYKGGIGLSNQNWTGGSSLSVVVGSKLEGLAAATRNVLSRYLAGSETISLTGIMNYDMRSSKYYHDLDGLMKSLTNQNSDYATWKIAFDQAVPYWATTEMNYSQYVGMFPMAGSAGLSIYIPQASKSSLYNFYRTFEWYTAGGWEMAGW